MQIGVDKLYFEGDFMNILCITYRHNVHFRFNGKIIMPLDNEVILSLPVINGERLV